MGPALVNAIVWLIAILLVIFVFAALRRRRSVGAAASGAVYDMLNEDKRKAIELIVEERAEARDPEDRDGNLPDLEDPNRRVRSPAGKGAANQR